MRLANSSVLYSFLIGICTLWGCSAGIGSEPLPDEPRTSRNPTTTAAKSEKPKNHLAGETSPYLLLHAHNPVDWYPWGPEAFEKAKKENKPIFLSIGYSSCYWCHVMERLVFENPAIAKLMNEHFVNIKVDREERPDVDDIYMTALLVYLQAVGSEQGGGWPLSLFLTPEGRPIAGGTYFPPEAKSGLPAFPNVLQTVHTAWTDNEETVRQNADLLAAEVRRVMRPSLTLKAVPLERGLVEDAVSAVLATYDPVHGGVDFSKDAAEGPKFPVPVKLTLLQYAAGRADNTEAAKALRHTLDEIARGGIRDHLGGGFHRYSTDRRWHVPHFEKMLYDQAQLAEVYLSAYQHTRDEQFRRAAEDTYAFVLRELTGPGGAFYSALDAETDGIEGQRYVWTKAEIARILGEADAELFAQVYGLDQPQHFEHGYVLHQPVPLDEVATKLNATVSQVEAKLKPLRGKLLAVRDQRPALLKDDKILTSWNGLMIRSLARASKQLDRPEYLAAAEKAMLFVLTNMRDEQGRLQRTHRDGTSKLNAYLDDYAFLVEALLALHDVTEDRKWLNAAGRLTDQQIAMFWDEKAHGFFFTPHHHEELLARTKNANDAVLPSGNSVSVRNLIRLASLTGNEDYRQKAEQTLQLFAAELQERPRGLANMALALGEFLDAPDFAAGHADGAVLQVAAETPADKKEEIVTARAFLDVDKLPAGSTCRIAIYVDVKQGWHINQNPAVPKNLIPTKFTLESAVGVTVEDVEYPKGTPLQVEGFDEPALVYEGQMVIRGKLRVPAAMAEADEIQLSIRYQPCNDKTCLAPKTAKLTGKVPLARPGEQVKLVNQKLFPPQRLGERQP